MPVQWSTPKHVLDMFTSLAGTIEIHEDDEGGNEGAEIQATAKDTWVEYVSMSKHVAVFLPSLHHTALSNGVHNAPGA